AGGAVRAGARHGAAVHGAGGSRRPDRRSHPGARESLKLPRRSVRHDREAGRVATENRPMTSNVVELRPAGRADPFAPVAPRLLAALEAELARCPPRPTGIPASVAWLQEPAGTLGNRPLARRALEQLRDSLFHAPGRDAEMRLLWREGLASACYARVIAAQVGFDSPLLTGAALLHRVGEIAALHALARAEA